MSLIFHLNDPCPKCRKPTMQAVIELHPSRNDLAIHNFYCADCGPVKTKVISLTPAAQPSEVAA
jgi:ssDNA-binding Zn-finger/Zn-ribbon topoisomerase 1